MCKSVEAQVVGPASETRRIVEQIHHDRECLEKSSLALVVYLNVGSNSLYQMFRLVLGKVSAQPGVLTEHLLEFRDGATFPKAF